MPTAEFLFPETGAKRFSERPASVPQKDPSKAVLLRSFLTFLKQLFFKKNFRAYRDFTEHKNVSEYKKLSKYRSFTEYKNVSEYKKVSEYKNFTEYEKSLGI